MRKALIIAICCCVGVVAILAMTKFGKETTAVSERGEKGEETKVAKEYPDAIPVRSWDGVAGDYIICKTKLEDELKRSYTDTGSVSHFSSKLTLDEMVQTNQEDFVRNIQYYYLRFPNEGRLFFHDNNYYVLYYDEATKEFVARNCFSVYIYEMDWVNVPMPMTIGFDRDVFKVCEELGSPLLDAVFEVYSFDELCAYYQRMNDDVYEIDAEKQTITIDGYYEKKKKRMDRFLVIDFANRCVKAKNAEGKEEVWK